MIETTIKRATPNDAAALAHLAERTFRDTFGTADNITDMDLHCAQSFSAEIQQKEILDKNYVTLLVEVEGQLVAFSQVRLRSPKDCVSAVRSSKPRSPEEPPSELYRLYLSKEWHGRGVAQTIMSEILSTVTQAGVDCVWLGVWEQNPKAIAFYRKCGFTAVGEHVFQFGNDPQRDLIMMRMVDAS
ncbi:MAG: GNAT family N-acetyltransferase [Cyanobacteria bacterium P01_D01_bin.105]